MLLLSTHRRLALAGALIAALTLAGSAAAGSPPRSSHASSTAVTHAAGAGTESGDDTPDASHPDVGNTVSAAAQTDTVGGAHQNHGGYVSCVARGGSDCTSTTPTLPTHGAPENPGGSAPTH
jgi:hypothetical protein